jgi:hypothetical protein
MHVVVFVVMAMVVVVIVTWMRVWVKVTVDTREAVVLLAVVMDACDVPGQTPEHWGR